ncbi:MAG: Nramp family divalent metal transporter [Verrucomicrobia bacterium]|nr:Nramp family divalent metal transporter [Verrucomicrobiota bacterium]
MHASPPESPAAADEPSGTLAEPPPRNFLQTLGPGLITGASDDDPSGIATYSQVGAQFGYSILWTMLFSYPLMVAVQEISARLGRVTGRGLGANLRQHAPAFVVYPIVLLLLAANILNLGADISAMGAALQLLLGGPAMLYAAIFAIGSLLLQIFLPYTTYARFLKWLCLSLFAYVGTVFALQIPWGEALRGTLLPSLRLDADALMALVAILGTTISPYLFFWQASAEVEDLRSHPEEQPLCRAPEQAPEQLARIRLDTRLGMAASNLIAYFIILTTAATLHAHGKTHIETAAQAAEALRPVAGEAAFLLFGLGIIGTGLLAVPVLAGSAAFAVGEVLRWRTGLERKPREAAGFYGVLAVATLVGLGLTFMRLDPIRALFWSAVLNGLVAVPVLVLLLRLGSSARLMGEFRVTGGLRVVGWLATGVMALAAAALLVSWLR